ncbi:MAG: acetyl-CoA carboxylase biotin carboxylase subunit, partial [Rhizobiales bacterium]|nr:acetyl-CoA carboxylase biotin carboxylase subunit [Hyphomicrobiales bacterium]
MANVGDKVLAKAAAVAAGVPVAPGSDGRLDDVAAGRSVAAEVGFPLMLKASAGGGGRGIRVVAA